MKPMYWCLLGVPGVGKSTYAKALARHLGVQPDLESAEGFPLVAPSFTDPTLSYANQLDFILSKARDQIRFSIAERPIVHETDVLGTHLLWTPALRQLGDITRTQQSTLDAIVRRLVSGPLRQPDLYIVLTAPTEVVLRRIAARGRSFEFESIKMPGLLSNMSRRLETIGEKLGGRSLVIDVGSMSEDDYVESARSAIADRLNIGADPQRPI